MQYRWSIISAYNKNAPDTCPEINLCSFVVICLLRVGERSSNVCCSKRLFKCIGVFERIYSNMLMFFSATLSQLILLQGGQNCRFELFTTEWWIIRWGRPLFACFCGSEIVKFKLYSLSYVQACGWATGRHCDRNGERKLLEGNCVACRTDVQSGTAWYHRFPAAVARARL